MDRRQAARVSALHIMQGRAAAHLLRSRGRKQHAQNLEAALDALTEILAREVGRPELVQAIDRASEELWDCDGLGAASVCRH